jgi:putative thioredoxin
MTLSPFIADVTRETFETEVLDRSHETPVLVDFWAAWCGPCKMLMPVLSALAGEYQGKFFLAKVNSDDEQQLASQYGVRSLPTVKLFVNGQPVDEFMGVQPEKTVRALLDRHIPRESDALIRQAVAAARAGQSGQALEIMQRAMTLDPASDRVKLELARLMARLRRVDEAEQILQAASAEARDSDPAAALRARFGFIRTVQSARPPEILQQAIAANPRDSAARYELAAHRALGQEYESALELLLEIVRTDRKWQDDAARKAMISIFSLLGSNELVNQYRRKLSLALN